MSSYEVYIVKTTLCSICLNNYPLVCVNCQEKIDSGEISELDVRVIRVFMDLEKSFPPLKETTFIRAIQTNGLIIVLVSRGDGRRLRPALRKIQRLAEAKLDSIVRVVEESRNPQHILRDLIRPVRIQGINTIWLPDNSFERKVRLSSRDQSRIHLDIARLEQIVYELSGERIRISFD